MKLKSNVIYDYTLIVIGSLLAGLSYTLFLVPLKVVPGGVTGVAIVLHYLFHLPFGFMVVLLNIPLFIAGIKYLGKVFGWRTFWGTALLSGFSWIGDIVLKNYIPTHDPMLATLYGGTMLGIGMGLIFRGQGSTGGSDIIARIINRFSNTSTGSAIFMIDVVVITMAGMVFKNMELMLYSYISLFLSSKVVDMVLEGKSYVRAAYIFSDKYQEIADAIHTKMNRGTSLIEAHGGYTGVKRPMLFCVFTIKELYTLKDIITSIDKDAFVVMNDVYDVSGKGFKTRGIV